MAERKRQKLYIKEGQTMQWPKEKGQKNKEQSIKHYTENLRLSNMNSSALEG